MKQYKDYKSVPKKYKFDLESILEKQSFEDLTEELFLYFENQIKIKDTKYDSKEAYLKYLIEEEKSTILFNKISNYISNNLSINLIDKKFNKINEEINFKFFNYQKKLGSEANRIFKNEKKLKEWIKLDEFKNYKKDIEFALEQKKYKFSDQIEDFISRISRASIDSYEIFSIITNSELNYGFAISSKNKKIKITPANRQSLMMSKDEMVRKTTQINWIKAYLNHKNSLASLLYQHFKKISTWAIERGYNSTVESFISNDKVDIKLLKMLYTEVKNKKNIFGKFHKAHKKFFNVKYKKKYKPWDGYLPLIKTKENYSIEESQKIVKEALKPMGKEYISVINKMFSENWVDYCIVDNKRSGAYSIGNTFGIDKKFILMNHDGKLNSVSTLAHEAGHSLHSYFSDNNQPYNLSQYPIFLAEIASIFNELMLNDYLMNNTKDEKLQFYLLSESIQEFEATVRRQTMWSEYEFEFYNRVDKGEALSTFDSVKEIYKNVVQQYYLSKNRLKNDRDLYASIMVPHFYYDFYVYKYAIGYLVANYFFQEYKKQGSTAIKNYIDNFLKKGDSKWPIDLLKDAGIDLYEKSFYDNAFHQLEKQVNKYIKLGNKLFKIKK